MEQSLFFLLFFPRHLVDHIWVVTQKWCLYPQHILMVGVAVILMLKPSLLAALCKETAGSILWLGIPKLKNFATLLQYCLNYEMVRTSMPKIFWIILFTFLSPLITYLSLCLQHISLSTLSVACLLSWSDQNALSGLNENKSAMMICFSLLSIVWIGSW